MALSCYSRCGYPHRELIVVDDGEDKPVDPAAVEAVGGKLLRVPTGTPIGDKLNHGLDAARGVWCQKMDDDDWYGPGFLPAMIEAVMDHRKDVCRPAVAFLMPYLFFEVSDWEIRYSRVNAMPGATLVFAREDWEQRPFRSLFQDEDTWFLLDQTRSGAVALPVRSEEATRSYLAVRHSRVGKDRGHTWTANSDGRSMEEYLQHERPVFAKPEEVLPEWALGFYRELKGDLA